MAEKKKFSVYTHSEGRTGAEQLVEFTCDPKDVEKVKDLLSLIAIVKIPISSYVSRPPHGGFGRYSRFEIEQHKYAGGGSPGNGGYIEVLEVKNPPDNRQGIVLHGYDSSKEAYFSEFTEIEQAKDAFEKNWHSKENPEKLAILPGFIRTVKCGELTPWFYAIGYQELVGDYAFPEDLQEDPVYRFGRQFVVTELNKKGEEFTRIRTCMGARVYEVENYDSYSYERRREKHTKRIVYWDDGTSTSSDKTDEKEIRPLLENELWITKATQEFQKLLAGRKNEFSIDFNDGSKFIGKIKPKDQKQQSIGGNYYAEVTFENGEQIEGQLDFQPTLKYPTIQEYISGKMGEKKGKIIEMKVKLQRSEKSDKKWSGFFYNRSDRP